MAGWHQQYSNEGNPPLPPNSQVWCYFKIAIYWHVNNDNIMHLVVNNLAWKHIDTDAVFGNFGCDKRNMWLALTLDGVNLFKLSNSNWSPWLMLILIYNFEPWLVTNLFFHIIVHVDFREEVTVSDKHWCLHTTTIEGDPRIMVWGWCTRFFPTTKELQFHLACLTYVDHFQFSCIWPHLWSYL